MKKHTKENLKPRFDINKISSSNELSKEFLNHIKYSIEVEKEVTDLKDIITATLLIVISMILIACISVLFIDFSPLTLVFNIFIAYFTPTLTSKLIYSRLISKKGKSLENLIEFCGRDNLSFFHYKYLDSFNDKYNFDKIKKALNNHDFQSPDLSSFINDFFDFTQDDLKELNNDEIKLLFEKSKPYPKMANKILKSIKKKKPIRKINARYFLDKVQKKENKSLKIKRCKNDISSINLEDYLSNELNGVLLTPQKEYMDII